MCIFYPKFIKMKTLILVPIFCVICFSGIASGNQIFTNEERPGSGINLTPGQDLVLVCNNTQIPDDELIWLKDGQRVQNTSGRVHQENCTLVIKTALEAEAGNYTCISSDKSNATIAVRTIVKLVPFDNSRNVVQGQNIVLICNVTQGMPLPEIKWTKGDEELNMSDPRVSIKADSRDINGTELIIGDAQFDDRAEYTCTASNGYSSANATILVRVKDKYAALWPFLGICAEVAVLCTIIFIYEKRRQKPDFDESETEHNTENKNIPDQEDKSRDIRQRK